MHCETMHGGGTHVRHKGLRTRRSLLLGGWVVDLGSGCRPDPLVHRSTGRRPEGFEFPFGNVGSGRRPDPSAVWGLSAFILAKGQTHLTLDLGTLDLAGGQTPL
jgi:hypothetical protein